MLHRWLLSASFAALSSLPSAQVGEVLHAQEISATAGGLVGPVAPGDRFGASVARLGDLDGDGIDELAVGAPWDDTGASFAGAVWILFPNPDGTVRAERKLAAATGGFGGTLGAQHQFGTALAPLGDVDGDGLPDLAVGAPGDRAVWILLLAADGTVHGEQRIAHVSPHTFGDALAPVDDLDGDGIGELAVGESSFNFGRGAFWILFLNPDATVRTERRITAGINGFSAALDPDDAFGAALAPLGDLDGDGIADLAVGAPGDDDGGTDQGTVWLLFLQADGRVRALARIGATAGGFGGSLDPSDRFGAALASADLDRDGRAELAVGATGDDDGASGAGAAWLCFLHPDGSVARERKLAPGSSGFGGTLSSQDRFGGALAFVGDVDGDGATELAAGAPTSDAAGADDGALWVVFLRGGRDVYGPATPIPAGEGVGRIGPRLLLVDADGPDGVLRSVQAAVDRARDGDVVLVRSGTYGPVEIVGKSVHVLAEAGAAATSLGSLSIRDLAPDEAVVVRGFRTNVQLADAHGPVWLEDCHLAASAIDSCAQVGLFRSTVLGATVFTGFACPSGGSALVVTDSTLFAYDTAFTGLGGCGAIVDDTACGSFLCQEIPATPGANALELAGTATALLFRCTVQGGDGGFGTVYTGDCTFCTDSLDAAPGGHGLVAPAGTAVASMETAFAGGAGQPSGQATFGLGMSTSLAGHTCDYVVDLPVIRATPADLEFTGEPGSRAFLTYAETFAPTYVAEFSGYSVVDPASPTLFLGTIPPSGVLQVQLPLDVLVGRQQAAVLYTQSKLYDPVTGAGTLGAPSVFLELRRAP